MCTEKYALVTGASSGIGLELASKIAANGWPVILVARDAQRLKSLKDRFTTSFKVPVLTIRKDLSECGAPREIFDELTSDGISVGMLVNCAGSTIHGVFHEIEWDREMRMLQVNLVSLTHLTRLFVDKMVEDDFGYILNVASTAAFKPSPREALYYASKAFVLSFTEALHEELAHSNIHVSCLCPGATFTPFFKNAGINVSRKEADLMTRPDQVADAGFKGLMGNRSLVIPGFLNRLQPQVIRFLPRKVAMMIMNYSMGKVTMTDRN